MTTPPSAKDWPVLVGILRGTYETGPKSLRQIAEEIGITHPTLIKILSGETENPYPKNRSRVARWLVAEVPALQYGLTATEEEVMGQVKNRADAVRRTMHSIEKEQLAAPMVADPNTLRRALGVVGPEDIKTRIAIVREFEDVYLEAGFTPETWPEWFKELRDEIYGRR